PPECVVVVAVGCELVSASKFPANRENNREFCRMRPSVAIFVLNEPAASIAYNGIPYATEQGISKRVSGKIFQETGNRYVAPWRIESTSSAIEGNPRLRRPKDLRRNARPLPAARAFATKPVSSLFRGDLRCRDELRHPLLSAFKVLAVHR